MSYRIIGIIDINNILSSGPFQYAGSAGNCYNTIHACKLALECWQALCAIGAGGTSAVVAHPGSTLVQPALNVSLPKRATTSANHR